MMRLTITKFALLLLVGLSTLRLSAQAPAAPAASLAEMKKLSFLVGNWQGEGWVEIAPGQRHAFRSTEQVEMKLDGMFLLIEGIHYTKIPGRTEDLKTHHAVATVTFDAAANGFQMVAHKIDGKSITPRIEVKDGAILWGFKDPRLGHLRYTIRLNSAGQWSETGERSTDGETWQKFFEMTLSREKKTAAP